MTKTRWMRMMLSGALLLGAGKMAAADNHSDDQLERKIEDQLHRQPALKDVKVDVHDGVTTLKGDVASKGEKEQAATLARSLGAARVEDKIDVDVGRAKDQVDDSAKAKKQAVEQRADREKEHIDQQATAKKAQLEKREAATHETSGGTVGAVEGSFITTKIKSKFVGDSLLKGSDIKVDTGNDGTVTLSGTAPSRTARQHAVDVARSTDGVRHVTDKISLGKSE
jgi:osmotically-inducible protein OsmY